jgi:hypothetical protein
MLMTLDFTQENSVLACKRDEIFFMKIKKTFSLEEGFIYTFNILLSYGFCGVGGAA